MTYAPFSPLSAQSFLRLANATGFALEEDDLGQLARRRLLIPLGPDDAPGYVRLHLYVLALYDEAVTVRRHPWATRQAERSLDEVSRLARTVDELVRASDAPLRAPNARQAASDLALELERYVHDIDPFGPFAGIADLLRDEAVDRLRGRGRLYVELLRGARDLAEWIEGGGQEDSEGDQAKPEREPEPEPETGELVLTDDADDADDAEASAPQPTADLAGSIAGSIAGAEPPTLIVAEAPQEAPVNQEQPVQEQSDSKQAAPEQAAPEQIEQKQIEQEQREEEPAAATAGEAEESEETPGQKLARKLARKLAEKSAEKPADQTLRGYALLHAGAMPADQTFELTLDMALDDEIDEIDEGVDPDATADMDTAVAAAVLKADAGSPKPAPPEPPPRDEIVQPPDTGAQAKSEPTSEPTSEEPVEAKKEPAKGSDEESLAAQITELNRLRERLLQAQDWKGLVELYEERIGLFEAPGERQQVFLTLAALYERKLEQPDRAFRCFRRALDTRAEAGHDKAREGLRRLGASDALRQDYQSWLEARLSGDIDDAERRIIQRDLALALYESGDHQRAFLQFAAFLAERPDDHVTPQALDDLETLAAHVDDEELLGFYDDLLDQGPAAAVREAVSVRAALLFRARSQPHHTLRFFRQALDANPLNEVAFNHLGHLYEDERSYPDLIRLFEDRIAATDGAERLRLRKRLEEIVGQEVNEEEDAVERYAARVEADPSDRIALERLVQAYQARQALPEAYGFLNRLVATVSRDDDRVFVLSTLAEIARKHLNAPEEAALHYENALAVAGERHDLLEALADARLEAGDWSEAVATIEKLSLAGTELPVELQLQWLERGVGAAREAGREEQRRHFLESIRRLDPEHQSLDGD